jgi:arabinofuranosyltransferase
MQAMRKNKAQELIWFLVIWCLYACLVYRFWSVYDDAFISFRYANNLAKGYGIRYNLGSHTPVEGYSNFLWVLLLSCISHLGWDLVFWAPVLSFLSGSLLLWMVWRTCLDHLNLDLPVALITTLFLAAFPPFALWSSGGLATMPFALCFFLTFYLLFFSKQRHWGVEAGFAGLTLALLRVEGVVWCLFFASCTILFRPRARRHFWRQFGAFLLIVLIGVAVHWIWRLNYHGDLIPNTVHAKGDLSIWTLQRGTNYIVVFFLTFLTPLISLPASVFLAKRAEHEVGGSLVLVWWATVGYAVLVGGDFMAMGRFLVPGFPFLALMFGLLLQSLWHWIPTRRHFLLIALSFGLIVVGLLPTWNLHLIPEPIQSTFHFRYNSPMFLSEIEQWNAMNSRSRIWKDMGIALADYAASSDSLVLGPVGNVGYYSNLYLYDLYGLLNREVAALSALELEALWQLDGTDQAFGSPRRSPGHDKQVPPSFFLPMEPTYIAAQVFEGYNLRGQITDYLEPFAQSPLYVEYVPEIASRDVNNSTSVVQIVLVMRRLRAGENAEEMWNSFSSSLITFLEQSEGTAQGFP